MTLEPRPGGRWFRDLGDDNGHFWGHVQAIKRPTLLEITGPLFMSSRSCLERAVPPQGSRRRHVGHAESLGIRPRSGRLSRRHLAGLDARCSSAFGKRAEAAVTHHADETEATMALIDGLLQELEQEAQTTRRVLERVPDDQLTWRPHEKATDARPARAARRERARRRRRDCRAVPGPGSRSSSTPVRQSAAELIPTLDEASRRRRSCSAAWTTRRSWRRGA